MNKILLLVNKRLLFCFFIFCFGQAVVLAQAVGDYRSKVTIGNWSDPTSWERWDGSTWIQATVAQGYPGQYTVTSSVLIQSSHTITMNIATTPQSIEQFTISGQLNLMDNTIHTINTSLLIVTSSSGVIVFGKKSDLKLPSNASIQVGSGGLQGSCSNNNSLFLGTTEIAVCAGGGKSTPTFQEVMDNGGYNTVKVTPGSDSSCGPKTFSFSATAFPLSNATIKWYTVATGGTAFRTISSGTDTYTQNLNASTTYYVEAVYSGYITPRTSVVATVNSLPTVAGTISGATSVCQGQSNVSYVIPAITNASTYTWAYSGTGATITGNTNNPKITFGSNATSGNLTVYGVNACGNGPISANYAISVNSTLAPAVGAITQPDCVTSKGSVVLSGLPASGTLSQTGTVINSYVITGTTMTISGLAVGVYQFSASNGSCSTVATGNVTINSTVTNTWNGTVWSNGTPTLSDKIVFAENYSVDVNVNGCSCTVSGSKNVVIKAGRTMKIVNEVTVLGTGAGAGKLTFENGASLVQVNDAAVNSGKIIYMRETTPISNFDYTYWSSPVIDQKLIDLSPSTLGDKFMSFDSGIDNWRYEDAYNNMMGTGVGYIIRGPQSYAAPAPPSTYLASFIGVPNNGALSTSIGVAGNSNLIGNPYPSALDANSFLIANNTLLDGTIYFWTHNTDIAKNVSNPGSGVYAYSSDDYATYNLSGGVATQAPSSTNPGAVNSNAPTGKIASGQAFFGTSIKAGNAVFNNNMRVGVGTLTGNNSQFFKFENTKKSTVAVEANRVWLDLTNKQGAFKETLIAYITGATNDYESAYDGESFDGNAFIDFYSLNSDKNLTIQGRALPFDNSEVIPLGYTTTIAGDFSINIRDKDGFFTTQKVFLEDKLLDTVFDLTQGTYNFTTEDGVFNDRFVLAYTNKTLAIDSFVDTKFGVLISNKNKEVSIKSSDELIDKVFVYDFSGKQLYKKIKVDNTEYSIPNLGFTDQGLIVKVVLHNGQTINKKIMY